MIYIYVAKTVIQKFQWKRHVVNNDERTDN